LLRRTFVIASAIAALGAVCSGPERLECITEDPECAPLYAPTWENVFSNTLRPKCGTGGGACHEGVGAKGGLRLDESVSGYESITRAGRGWVLTDDPGCSEILQRVYSDSDVLRMPRGSSLPESERCALQQWVLAGAPGPVDAGVDAP
jgi:hypothetical protein